MKNRVLLACALLVFGLPAAAQAQDFARVTLEGQPAPTAREGGEREESADVFLLFSDADAAEGATIELHYSAPIPTGLTLNNATTAEQASNMVRVGDKVDDVASRIMPTNSRNDDNGTIVLTLLGTLDDGDLSLSIKDVILDVSKHSGPVTVRLVVKPADENTILVSGSNTLTVINDVALGISTTLKGRPGDVSTRGKSTPYTAELVVEEGFRGSFGVGDILELEVAGIPPEVEVKITAVTSSDGVADKAGDKTVMLSTTSLTGNDDGEDRTATVTLGELDFTRDAVGTVGEDGYVAGADEDDTRPDEFLLTMTMTVNPNTLNTKVSYPLLVGNITARLTFSGSNVTGGATFDDAFTPSVAMFKISIDDCTLLFPVVSVLPDGNWNTAISILNPAGSGRTSGGLTFTFYGMDNPAVVYETTSMPTGIGLEDDGTLAPGGTYQVLASDILAATNWGATFRGHVRVTAGYTKCQGLGWVTDFMGVNQAYIAIDDN